jgi:hypothetical protein
LKAEGAGAGRRVLGEGEGWGGAESGGKERILLTNSFVRRPRCLIYNDLTLQIDLSAAHALAKSEQALPLASGTAFEFLVKSDAAKLLVIYGASFDYHISRKSGAKMVQTDIGCRVSTRSPNITCDKMPEIENGDILTISFKFSLLPDNMVSVKAFPFSVRFKSGNTLILEIEKVLPCEQMSNSDG